MISDKQLKRLGFKTKLIGYPNFKCYLFLVLFFNKTTIINLKSKFNTKNYNKYIREFDNHI